MGRCGVSTDRLRVAYCLANPRLAIMQRQPPDWRLFSVSQWTICFGSLLLLHVSAAKSLTLLIKASATMSQEKSIIRLQDLHYLQLCGVKLCHV